MGSIDAQRFPWLERTTSRVMLLAGLAAMAAGALLTEERRLSPRLVAAWVAAFVILKAVLAVLAHRAGWRGWTALAAEAGAFVCVGLVVVLGLRLDAGEPAALLLVLLTAVLLGAGTWLRRKAALADESEDQTDDSTTDDGGDRG